VEAVTTASQRGKRNRTHGHETERMVARWLKDNGWADAHTTRSRLGHDGFRQPGDIGGVDGVCIEVKGFMASSRWPTWRAQVLAEAGGRIPVVVRRTRGVTDVGLWEAEVPAVYLRWRTTPPPKCKRTGVNWVRLPFGELMEALR
jgi:hypothetical protein